MRDVNFVSIMVVARLNNFFSVYSDVDIRLSCSVFL